MSVNQYLDVRELERWMLQWKESIMAEAGITYTDSDPDQVLPVFVFDLPTKGMHPGKDAQVSEIEARVLCWQ
jgi:hypothetical protein